MIRPADWAGFEMDQLQLYVVRFNCTSVTFSWDLQHLQHPPLSSAINQPSSMNQHYPPPSPHGIHLGGGQRTPGDSSIDHLLTIEGENQKEESILIS